jgi:hypothetical protein
MDKDNGRPSQPWRVMGCRGVNWMVEGDGGGGGTDNFWATGKVGISQ